MKRALNRLKGKASQQLCPECDAPIPSDAINIKEGVALCPQCETLSPLSELNYSGRSIKEMLGQPPRGCSVVPSGQGVIATASLRSLPGFFGTVAVALFWNGIVSIFLLIAIAGLYANLVGPVPDWFPAPGVEDGKPEMNDGPMGLGMTLFLCIFLIPFVTIGAVMIATAVMNLIGKVEVAIHAPDSYVATGAGFIRWKRRFDPRQIHSVGYASSKWQSEDLSSQVIELSGDRTIRLGSLLPSERMEWMRVVLKESILHPDSNRLSLSLPHTSLVQQRI